MAKKKRRPLLKFPRRMQKKLIVMFTIVAGMLIGLIGRLMYIEYTSGEKYEKIVLSQQEYDSKVIPYQRGDIVDAKGTVMATSIAVYNVILDCSVLTLSLIHICLKRRRTDFRDYVRPDDRHSRQIPAVGH